jgi:5'-3' exonuclease
MKVNIDGDIVAYRAAAASENESLSVACLRADDTMRRILINTNADEYMNFLTGNNNFRREIDPQYKANRANLPRPRHLEDVKAFLVTDWNAQVSDGYEADDLLGINQTDDTILASIDKDLNQIPGKHYNFVKEEYYEVSPLEGMRFFYKQTLIGDTSDNVFGIRGIGPVKASKLIDTLDKEEEMYYTCRKLYKDDKRFHLNCKVLWILREEHQIWEPSNKCLAYYDQQLQELAADAAISDPQKMASSESTGPEISGSTVSGTETGVTV